MVKGDAMISYEERKANEKKLRPLATEVAKALGWQLEASKRDYDHYIEIHGPRGQMVGLSLAQAPGKLHVSPRFPDTDSKGKRIWNVPYGETSPSINVSMAKDATQIARDIERRFLPEYHRLLDLCVASTNGTKDFRARVRISAEALIDSFGGAIEGTPDDVRINLYHSEAFPEFLGDIKVNSEDSITFERFNLTLEEATAMLHELRNVRTSNALKKGD